ncbi:MAG TPA: hypothetical protein VHT73_03910 [Thermodesulfobacteriota bacterium]|nr:hypothetical protein [Thermodesulfobacteriota bacterium]
MKKLLVLLIALLIFGGCVGHSAGRENIPPPPSRDAIWVYGHHDSQGRWIPGRWVDD